MKSPWSRQRFGFHKRVPLLWAMPPMRHIECKSQRSHPAPKTIQKSLFVDHDHDHDHWCLFFVAFFVVQSSNHSVPICDKKNPSKAELANNFPPPRSAWALLRGPWQTWHFESLNHLTGILTSQTLCLKDLAPKFKKTNVSNFAPLSQLDYQFWRKIDFNFSHFNWNQCLLRPLGQNASSLQDGSTDLRGENCLWHLWVKMGDPRGTNLQFQTCRSSMIIYDHLSK